MVKEYGNLLREDPSYAAKAARVVELTRDIAEFLPQEIVATAGADSVAGADSGSGGARAARRVAFHSPCTLQHGLKVRGKVEALLAAMGAELVPVRDAHLCCGSAGTYSLLQPELSRTLRQQKLESLLENRPEVVLSANIGCIAHLQGATDTPVRHWIEWLDESLSA